MSIDIVFVLILAFHTFHLRGQTKIAYIEMCYKTRFSNKLFFDIYFKALNQTLRVHTHLHNIQYTYIENANILYIKNLHIRGQ